MCSATTKTWTVLLRFVVVECIHLLLLLLLRGVKLAYMRMRMRMRVVRKRIQKFVSTNVHFFTVSRLQTETHRIRFVLLHFVGLDPFRSPRPLVFLLGFGMPVPNPR